MIIVFVIRLASSGRFPMASQAFPLGRFFRVIIQKKRLSLLPAFKKTTQVKILKIQNIVEATIYVATKLSDASEATILNTLHQHVPQKIQASFETDPTLLGGFKAVVGHTVFDLSIRNTLDQLQTTIKLKSEGGKKNEN